MGFENSREVSLEEVIWNREIVGRAEAHIVE